MESCCNGTLNAHKDDDCMLPNQIFSFISSKEIVCVGTSFGPIKLLEIKYFGKTNQTTDTDKTKRVPR
jgi:hypothetical protein